MKSHFDLCLAINKSKSFIAFCCIEYVMGNTNTTLGKTITYSKSLISSAILKQVCLCRPREIKNCKTNYRDPATCHKISARLLPGINSMT